MPLVLVSRADAAAPRPAAASVRARPVTAGRRAGGAHPASREAVRIRHGGGIWTPEYRLRGAPARLTPSCVYARRVLICRSLTRARCNRSEHAITMVPYNFSAPKNHSGGYCPAGNQLGRTY